MCHLLIFLPLLSLPLYLIFPWQEATALYALINGPLLIVGWLVWRVHRRPPITGREGMIGRRATVKTTINPEGMVLCGNELWRAHSEVPVEAGEIVRVVGVDKLKLSILPYREEESSRFNTRLFECDRSAR